MKVKSQAVLLLLALPQFSLAADSQWILEQSTLTYHISHPLHQVDGVSRAARGKGICHAGQCDFLIAVPVKSFGFGDSNRDLHMLQVTRGAQFPLVTVRTRLPEADSTAAIIHADLEIQFAGQTAHYTQVPFQLTRCKATKPESQGQFRRPCRTSRLSRARRSEIIASAETFGGKPLSVVTGHGAISP